MLKRNKKEIQLLSKLEKEILTPITFIQGYAAILKNSFDLPESAIKNINKIDHSSERVLSAVQFLLMSFEVENDKKKIKLENIPVLSVTYESVAKFIRLAKTRKIDFSFSGQSTAKVITNKKLFVQAISAISQEILLALNKGNVSLDVEKEGGDIVLVFKIVFAQKDKTNLSETPGYEMAKLFLTKSKNKIAFSKKDDLQKISIRLNISE